ncbi:MAG: hypothetical protein QF692_01635 [Alphaproteobacteria bacterium]|nr:hypothetical protein [Alphaproteobacteria bacterium]MDP7221945.1 hypothetical protein [Alphaproteobacteria bacterium]
MTIQTAIYAQHGPSAHEVMTNEVMAQGGAHSPMQADTEFWAEDSYMINLVNQLELMKKAKEHRIEQLQAERLRCLAKLCC